MTHMDVGHNRPRLRLWIYQEQWSLALNVRLCVCLLLRAASGTIEYVRK